MKITNRHGLPETIVVASKAFDKKEKTGDISVTELISPPLIRQLRKRFNDKVTVDVVDRLWVLFGHAIHAVLDKAAEFLETECGADHEAALEITNLSNKSYYAEYGLSAEVLGWKVTGRPDLLDKEEVLTDYKVTGSYKVTGGSTDEWEKQLNVYRWLYNKTGHTVKKMQIAAIIRDWTKYKALADSDYPQIPFALIPIDKDEKIEEYIEERVRLHQEAEKLSIEEIPVCTPQERWTTEMAYAATKALGSRATKLFNDEKEAISFAKEKGLLVETRPGSDIRCLDYCEVKDFCPYGSSLKEAEQKSVSKPEATRKPKSDGKGAFARLRGGN